jgi:WD40 repeat protein
MNQRAFSHPHNSQSGTLESIALGYSLPSSRPLLVPQELFKLFNHDCTNIACRCNQRSVFRLSPHPRILHSPQIWSIALGTLLRSVVFPTALYSITADPGEYSLYAGGSDGRIFALSLQGSGSFDDETGSDGVLLGHSMAVTSLGVSSDGLTLVSGSEDGTAKVWDVNGRQLQRTLQQGKGERGFSCRLGSISEGKRPGKRLAFY